MDDGAKIGRWCTAVASPYSHGMSQDKSTKSGLKISIKRASRRCCVLCEFKWSWRLILIGVGWSKTGWREL